jgi:hypothetical protein
MARAMESTTRWDQKQAHAKPKFTQGGARPPQKKKKKEEKLSFSCDLKSGLWSLNPLGQISAYGAASHCSRHDQPNTTLTNRNKAD